ncbi:hypothetical protein F4824DRAFT_504402 [Ustulina deusta]|nr:hypothetical protein F4824DRAFT_504402 [Ustulina deusta]
MDEEEQPSINNEWHSNAPFLGGNASVDDQSKEPLKPLASCDHTPCNLGRGGPIRTPLTRSCAKPMRSSHRLAWIFGLSMSLGTVVGLVVVMPYGVLADQARSLVDDKGASNKGGMPGRSCPSMLARVKVISPNQRSHNDHDSNL